jgi:hypothetical protein
MRIDLSTIVAWIHLRPLSLAGGEGSPGLALGLGLGQAVHDVQCLTRMSSVMAIIERTRAAGRL